MYWDLKADALTTYLSQSNDLLRGLHKQQYWLCQIQMGELFYNILLGYVRL